MENTNNNTTNIAEKNNNKTKLYLGIGAIIVIGIGLFFFLSYPSGGKINEEEKIAKEVSQLIEREYITEKLYKSIQAYEDIDASNTQEKETSRQKLEKTYMKKENLEAYNETDLEKLKDKMSSMMACKKINELLKSFKKFCNQIEKFKKPPRISEVRSAIRSISSDLAIASQGISAKKGLQSAVKELNKCEELYGNKPGFQDILKQIDQQKQKIAHILSFIPDNPAIEKYDPKALKKALETWKKDYQEIWDNCVLIEILKILDN